MAKMDNLLKSELNTIREQHDRLQVFENISFIATMQG